jgi:hypothetical protein
VVVYRLRLLRQEQRQPVYLVLVLWRLFYLPIRRVRSAAKPTPNEDRALVTRMATSPLFASLCVDQDL